MEGSGSSCELFPDVCPAQLEETQRRLAAARLEAETAAAEPARKVGSPSSLPSPTFTHTNQRCIMVKAGLVSGCSLVRACVCACVRACVYYT